MKRFARYGCCVLASLVIAGCTSAIDRDVTTAMGVITPGLMHRHIFYLASDSMKGRNTPSPQLDTAARYIARQFDEAGVAPVHGSHFQHVPLNIVSLGHQNALSVRTDAGEHSYVIKTEFTPFDMTANKQVKAPIVFAGYGIAAPEYGYDDYRGLDVHGKIVFVLRHEPGEEDSLSVFEGRKATDYSNVATKVRIAIEHGAVGVMVATDPLNHTSLSPRGFPWPSLTKTIPKDALPMTLGLEESSKVPVVHVGEEVIAQLFGSVDSLRNLQKMIDGSMHGFSVPLRNAEATIRTSTEIQDMSASNVVGFIEGRDPVLKHEIVVVGAHYDHVGYNKDHAPGEDYIFNGADDNASGTSALLGVAAAFGALKVHPGRSILLIAFCGEEKGLFGSEYYVRNPLFPLAKTVAMINLDMVGRNAPDSLFIIDASRVPDLALIAREESDRAGFHLVDDEHAPGGSDHMNFLKKNVPSIFYHSGLHKDYHKVSDEPSLINTEKLARVAHLAFTTAWRCASDTAHFGLIKKPISLF